MKEMQRATVFATSAATVACLCQLNGGLNYLAPYLASSAVLANAGPQLRHTLVATIVVYAMSILLGALGPHVLPASPFSIVLLCLVAHSLCMASSHHHPPALALLAVVFLRQPDWQGVMWLQLTALGMAVVATTAHRISLVSLPKRGKTPA